MNKRITFRNMEHSTAIEESVGKQLEKIESFLKDERPPISIEVTLEASSVREHPHVELHVKTARHDLRTHYEHAGVDLYDAIARAIDVMYERLRIEKRKDADKKKTVGRHDDFKKQR